MPESADDFNLEHLMASHTQAYPAIEWIHGKPMLIFNVAEYADRNFEVLEGKTEAATVVVPDAYRKWAKDYIDYKQSFMGEDGKPRVFQTDAEHLAQAMSVAATEAPVFPRALSFINQMTFWSTIALVLMALLLLVVYRRKPDQVKPEGAFQHMMEALVLFVRDGIVRPNLHHHPDAWVPFFAALMLTFLTCNVFGLIPLFATATGSLGVTAAFALVTFGLTIYMGLKENGSSFWFKLIPVKFSLNPIQMFIFFLLMIIEWLSLIVRPVVLAVRLFVNMFAGHTVLLVFASLGFIAFSTAHSLTLGIPLGIFGWVMLVGIYVLELLVAFIQAYIFTLLSAVFIGMCAHPEH